MPPESNDPITGFVSELVGKFEEGTIEGGTVVVDQFDETRLDDEPAEFVG